VNTSYEQYPTIELIYMRSVTRLVGTPGRNHARPLFSILSLSESISSLVVGQPAFIFSIMFLGRRAVPRIFDKFYD
jgi:hypothetical protein